ncbi:MAG: hypothetical protein Tsb005_05280 [Gammaproteobacteria bacterium]
MKFNVQDHALTQLVYTCTASYEFDKDDLLALLQKCKTYNSLHDITGLLLYFEGSFLQVLEGDNATIQHLYETISKDPRQSSIFLLYEKPITRRDFAQWSMGFHALTQDEINAEPALSHFFDPKFQFNEMDNHQLKALLNAVRRINISHH